MVENLGDTDGEEKGQQFTPTDWDWVMFLSEEINAVKTRFDAVWTVGIAILCAFIGILTAFMVFQITYLVYSDSILDSTSSIIVIFVGAVIFVVACRVFSIFKEKKREAEDRVKLLEKCREDVFNRLDDPNKILECLFERCWKKDDKNK